MDSKHKTIQEIEEKVEHKTRKPPYYSVFLLNDDYTTMDFVVHVLERVFHKSSVEATQIMLHVHNKGKGLAGIFTRDIAVTKVDKVHRLAEEHAFPLKCKMEKT
ncbi:MAG: ATP-dependent Clp protease adaptor ClpS [Planctomycetes bacterium RBG_16_43_13]|nr:MAG: ATP-dependent Clp protease adaptor ClpS [Planctomycetes bacterium RBG_16_43_13]